MQQNDRRTVARRGEAIAAAHLCARRFELIARNVRTRHGEIDLIAVDRRTLVFVEVKTRCIERDRRTIRDDQDPLRGLGTRQRARLRRLASSWLRESRRARPFAHAVRFDAIGVVIDTCGAVRRIEHIENAW
jgi:putative endonuclease